MQTFDIKHKAQVDDGLGGFIEGWQTLMSVNGYIDFLTGSDLNNTQNAFTEESTHVLIIPNYTEGINDNMRIVDMDNRYYSITYSDNPVGIDHHNEIYLKYGGVDNG